MALHRAMSSRSLISPSDFGAVGDGIADDTAALRRMIDSLKKNSPAGIMAGLVAFDGTYAISDTVEWRRLGAHILGSGVGNSARYAAGTGATIIWLAGAGSTKPMFRVTDSMGLHFEGVRFEGRGLSPGVDTPTAGLAFTNTGSDQQGTNAMDVVSDCFFGKWVWTPGQLRDGALACGILVDGVNGNNDTLFIQRSQFSGHSDTGVKFLNTQSVWSRLEDCVFDSCALGLYANCDIQADNIAFNSCARDWWVDGTAWATVHNYQSENSGQLGKLGYYAHVMVQGGYSQLRAISGGVFIDGYPSRVGQQLVIREHSWRQNSVSPAPVIRLQPARGADTGTIPPRLHLENCNGITWEQATQGAVGVDSSDRRSLVIDNPDIGPLYRQVLTGTQVPARP